MDLWDWYSSTIKARVFYKILILSGSETGMLYEKLINTVAADALAPCVAMAIATMVYYWLCVVNRSVSSMG